MIPTNRQTTTAILMAVVGVCLVACNRHISHVHPAKHNTSAITGLVHGMRQSPINIVTKSAIKGHQHNVGIHYEPSSENIYNLGHTIEVKYDSGNRAIFDGKVYEFKQFHFHTPSEHHIDGRTYPMEMHMVHTLAGQAPGEKPQYLVVSILYKKGANNLFLDEFMNGIPAHGGEEAHFTNKMVNVNDLLGQTENMPYYYYHGSLTTPPYTQTVEWLVIQSIFEASPKQINRFKTLEGKNARHIQGRYGRRVEMCRGWKKVS